MLLHKTLTEILELPSLEIEIWRAYLMSKQEQAAFDQMVKRQEAAAVAAVRGR